MSDTAYGIICTFALSCCMIVLLAQYVYLFKYVHKSSSKLYQCNPYDSLILLIYNMCIIVLSFSLFYYMLYCAFRMECVPYVFAITPGDAPSLSYSYSNVSPGHFCSCAEWICTCAKRHCTDAFPVPSALAWRVQKGRVHNGPSDPLRQPRW